MAKTEFGPKVCMNLGPQELGLFQKMSSLMRDVKMIYFFFFFFKSHKYQLRSAALM